MGFYGQDWSSYQASEPNTAGLGFAVIKATQGLGYTNPRWQAQLAWARRNNLVTGLYHYPAMANDPAAELRYFLATVRPALTPDTFLVLDWEGYDTANKTVPMARQIAYKDAWLAAAKAQQPHTATGTYMNTDYLARDTTGRRGDFLWIATAGRPAGQPGIAGDWLFHQYGASDVDRDYCRLNTAADLRAWALSFSTPAKPPAAADRRRLDEEVR